jgi:hypothetical protein
VNKVKSGRVKKPRSRETKNQQDEDIEEDEQILIFQKGEDIDEDAASKNAANEDMSQMEEYNEKIAEGQLPQTDEYNDEAPKEQLIQEGQHIGDNNNEAEEEAEDDCLGPRLTDMVNGLDLSELTPLAYRVLEGQGYIRNGQWMGGA